MIDINTEKAELLTKIQVLANIFNIYGNFHAFKKRISINKPTNIYLFDSLSWPLKVVTVLIFDKTSSAIPPATAYFFCSRAEEDETS